MHRGQKVGVLFQKDLVGDSDMIGINTLSLPDDPVSRDGLITVPVKLRLQFEPSVVTVTFKEENSIPKPWTLRTLPVKYKTMSIK